MPLPKGTMTIEVLADGTLKIETGDMGGVAHKAADDMLDELQRAMGGAVEVTDVKGHAGHQHHFHDAHGHTHDHDHVGHKH